MSTQIIAGKCHKSSSQQISFTRGFVSRPVHCSWCPPALH